MPEWVLAPEEWRQALVEARLYQVERQLQELIEENLGPVVQGYE